jgi:hypothetical protein
LASFFTSLVRDNTPTPDLDSHHAFNMAEPENFEEDLFADLYVQTPSRNLSHDWRGCKQAILIL